MKKNNFLILITVFFIVSYLSKKILNVDQLLISSLSEEFTTYQVKQYINFQSNWEWILYVMMPVFILIKISLIALILYIGIYFFSKKKVSFDQLFDVVIKAEFIFLLVPIFKTTWFVLFQTQYTLQDVQTFYPLSALNIFDSKSLESWFIYPFQVLNLFELAYWLLLAYFLGKITETNTDEGLKIVAYSYGSSLFLWITIVMFFTLNYS